MANKLDKIIIKGSDWTVKKVNFSSSAIQENLKDIRRKQEEAFSRKDVDPETLKLIIKL